MAHLKDKQYKLQKSVKQCDLTSPTITTAIMKILSLRKNLVIPSSCLYRRLISKIHTYIAVKPVKLRDIFSCLWLDLVSR